MGPVSKLMTGLFAVDAAQGAGEGIKREVKNPGNRYNTVLGNNLIKAPAEGGAMNAANVNPMYRRASEEIDALYKEAELREVEDNDKEELPKWVIPAGMVGGAAGANYAVNRDVLRTLQQGAAGAGEGVKDFAHSIPRRMMGEGKYTRDLRNLLSGVKSNFRQRFGQAQKGDPMRDVYERVGKKKPSFRGVAESIRNTDAFQQAARTGRSVSPKAKAVATPVGLGIGAGIVAEKLRQHHQSKRASVIDEMFEKTAKPNLGTIKQKARRIGREATRSGAEGMAYFSAPALTGFAIKRNLANPVFDYIEDDSDRVVIDVPLENVQGKDNIQKTAFPAAGAGARGVNQAADMPWGQWAKEVLPKRSLHGLTWAAVPAAFTVGTGKNIKGRLEDIKGYESRLAPIEEGRARVTIESKPRRDDVIKQASEDIAKGMKKKLETADLEKRVNTKNRQRDRLINFDQMVEGMKKQERMQGVHEDHGFHP